MCVRRVWDAAEGGDQGPVLEEVLDGGAPRGKAGEKK